MGTKAGKETITTRRVKIEGRRKLLDTTTGELVDTVFTSVEERDFNFTKVWMMSLLPQLKIIGNKKIDVCMWIIEHLNKDNQLIGTYRQIAEESGISLETVKGTMQKLIECDFLRRINTGCYMVNPDVMFKGSKTGRENALFQFRSVSGTDNAPTSMTKQQQFDELQKNIAFLQKRAESLKEQIKKDDTEDEVDAVRKEMIARKRKATAKEDAED